MFNNTLLKQIRKQQNLSQQEMANRLSMEQSTYNRYETNKAQPGFHVLEKIKEEFGVEPSEFFISDNITFNKNGNHLKKADLAIQYSVSKEVIETIITNNKNVIEALKRIVGGYIMYTQIFLDIISPL